LADRDRALVCEQLAQFVEALRVRLGGLVRMNAERCPDTVLAPRDRERLPAGIQPGSDGDDPLHPGLPRPSDEHLRRFHARVEVRVRVRHAAASSASGSVARGKPCFPRVPPSSSKLASAPPRIPFGGTSRFPPSPPPLPLPRPPSAGRPAGTAGPPARCHRPPPPFPGRPGRARPRPAG